MSTEKKFKIASFMMLMFVGIVSLSGIFSPVPEILMDAIQDKLKLPLIIFFIINSVLLAIYCYYWGKSTGENKNITDKSKQRLSGDLIQ